MAICEILSVGTELLLGDILNTNTQYLSRRFADMGISVFYHTSVGDNPERLAGAVRTALSRSDIVIATGGLGPTPDDITAEICCREFGFELEFDKATADKITAFFIAKGVEMPRSNLKQAYVPKGGTVLENTHGTAPGVGMKKDGKCLVLLPGPPYEMSEIFEKHVVPYLSEYRSGAIVSHEVRTMGISESRLAEEFSDLLSRENPTVAPYCKIGEALLRVTARADSAEEAERMTQQVIEVIRGRIGEYIYGIDCKNTEDAAVPMLRKAGLTVATAESCTGGLIAKRITDIPGASAVFKHGVITYANEVKVRELGVSEKTLSDYGAVSEETAVEMAKGIRRKSGADIGLSVTGFAGPDADEDGKSPGLIYVAIDAQGFTECEKIETGRNERDYNRYTAASRALNLIVKYLKTELKI